MRRGYLFSCFALLIACLHSPSAADARSAADEGYEAYLEQIRTICEVDCMAPRQLLRKLRRQGAGDGEDRAVVLDIAAVTQWNGKYLLHSALAGTMPNNLLGLRTPTRRRPITGRNEIVIEMDRETFFSMLNVPVPGSREAREGYLDENGDIVVSEDRIRKLSRPTLAKLRTMFLNRRIVVRGKPRLEPVIIGARFDRRLKKLFLEVTNPDDLAVLPRFDKNGEPILDDMPWVRARAEKNNR